MTNELSNKIWVAVSDFIHHEFDQVTLESYGLSGTDILGSPVDDPDDLPVSDVTACRAFPQAVFGNDEKMEWDWDAFAEIEQAILESCENFHRLAAWEAWYCDNGIQAYDLACLISDLVAAPGIDTWAGEEIICFALDSGLVSMLPTGKTPDDYLRADHLYWAWRKQVIANAWAA